MGERGHPRRRPAVAVGGVHIVNRTQTNYCGLPKERNRNADERGGAVERWREEAFAVGRRLNSASSSTPPPCPGLCRSGVCAAQIEPSAAAVDPGRSGRRDRRQASCAPAGVGREDRRCRFCHSAAREGGGAGKAVPCFEHAPGQRGPLPPRVQGLAGLGIGIIMVLVRKTNPSAAHMMAPSPLLRSRRRRRPPTADSAAPEPLQSSK
jgi:hypothetical protein